MSEAASHEPPQAASPWWATPAARVLLWVPPLGVAALCLLALPFWILGVPGVGGTAYAEAWRLGFDIIFDYPPTVLAFFVLMLVHRWLSRPTVKPKVVLAYAIVAYLCLATALGYMIAVWMKMFR